MIITADRDKVFRRIHDQHIMGETINLGYDYSTGVKRADSASYYEQITNPAKQVVIETYVSEQELETIKTIFPQWTAGEQVWAKDGTIDQNSLKEALAAGKEVYIEGKDVIASFKPKKELQPVNEIKEDEPIVEKKRTFKR
jgi:hypothetical protein